MTSMIICSGGLDSVTLAHRYAEKSGDLVLVSFDYGQKHHKELDFARACAQRLCARHEIVDIMAVGRLLGGNALTGEIRVPDGHYTRETMRVTVVPNRNAIMLAVAYGLAAAMGAGTVATAVHGGDHYIYPDCRPDFIESFRHMEKHALDGLCNISLAAPFLHMTKADIVSEGVRLGVPFSETWSCYKGGARHCGRCGTCVERREAFHLAKVADPTDYDDPDYWRTVTDH